MSIFPGSPPGELQGSWAPAETREHGTLGDKFSLLYHSYVTVKLQLRLDTARDHTAVWGHGTAHASPAGATARPITAAHAKAALPGLQGFFFIKRSLEQVSFPAPAPAPAPPPSASRIRQVSLPKCWCKGLKKLSRRENDCNRVWDASEWTSRCEGHCQAPTHLHLWYIITAQRLFTTVPLPTDPRRSVLRRCCGCSLQLAQRCGPICSS
eukprot:gene20591-biopygen5597